MAETPRPTRLASRATLVVDVVLAAHVTAK